MKISNRVIFSVLLRSAAVLTAGLLFYLSTLSLSYNVFGFGSSFILAVSVCTLLTGLFWGTIRKVITSIRKKKLGKILILVVSILLSAGLICFAVISICILTVPSGPVQPDSTVIVLGARIVGSSPTMSLYGRLKTAARYLADNPDAICIVSGGQGQDEIMTEADAMKNWLTANGISADRIITEPQSTDTRSNLENSAKIIEARGLSKDVVIITDDFHEYRALHLARQSGLTPVAYPSQSPFALRIGFFIREVFAVFKDVWLTVLF